MASINFDTLSLSELKSLQKNVTKAIAEFSDRKKTEALLALEARAKELGFNFAELIGARKTRKSSGSGGPKYRHPENPEITWSGKGRRPAWFLAAVEAGKSAEAMAL